MKPFPSLFFTVMRRLAFDRESTSPLSLALERVSSAPEFFWHIAPLQPTYEQKINPQERLEEKCRAHLELELQAIHEEESKLLCMLQEQESKLLCKLQEQDIDFIIQVKKGNSSLEKWTHIFKTRSDGVCKTILELTEQFSNRMDIDLCGDLAFEALKRNLLQTLEYIIQVKPGKILIHFKRSPQLNELVKNCSKETFEFVFSKEQGWEEQIDGIWIMQSAKSKNKPKLFLYMLQTLSKITKKSIIITLGFMDMGRKTPQEQYENTLNWARKNNYTEIIKTLTEKTDDNYTEEMFTSGIDYETELILKRATRTGYTQNMLTRPMDSDDTDTLTEGTDDENDSE